MGFKQIYLLPQVLIKYSVDLTYKCMTFLDNYKTCMAVFNLLTLSYLSIPTGSSGGGSLGLPPFPLAFFYNHNKHTVDN